MNLISEAIWLVVATGVVYCLGRYEHARVSKESELKHVHGQYIPEWVAVGFLTPGLVMLYHGIEVFSGYSGAFGVCLFGLLCGLAIGWIHGGLRLRWFRARSAVDDVLIPCCPPEDGNPYRPPQSG